MSKTSHFYSGIVDGEVIHAEFFGKSSMVFLLVQILFYFYMHFDFCCRLQKEGEAAFCICENNLLNVVLGIRNIF